MYTVYLVDDECLALSDMEQSIPWVEHDLVVVGRNIDARKAQEEILDLRPEVVFTDIRMPGCDGVEMIGALRERGADCEFVVVSAHEDFGYARQLIQLGGFDYLIKPVLGGQYTELLIRLTSCLEQKHPGHGIPATSSQELNRIVLYLNHNLSQKHSLKDIASKFSISANYICSLFSKRLQTTFSTYMTQIRMERADQLLALTQKTVKEIAADCGYEDYFYFCRVFRDYYGCTPTQKRGIRGAHHAQG